MQALEARHTEIIHGLRILDFSKLDKKYPKFGKLEHTKGRSTPKPWSSYGVVDLPLNSIFSRLRTFWVGKSPAEHLGRPSKLSYQKFIP